MPGRPPLSTPPTADEAGPAKRPRIDPDKRRAAVIATAVTLPLVVILALLFGALSGSSGSGPQTGPLPAITAAAPPDAAAQTAPCTALLEALPVQLRTLDPRVVHTTPSTEATPFVVAWGDPAIVLSCGVAKPAGFGPGSDADLIEGGGGAFYYVGKSGDANVFTVVDRVAYVSITIPGQYQGADYLTPLNSAIVTAMPKAVCSTDASTPNPDTLCSRRS